MNRKQRTAKQTEQWTVKYGKKYLSWLSEKPIDRLFATVAVLVIVYALAVSVL